MNQPMDYHDYVFRDGQLVGEFEQMYRHSLTTPWHQDEQDEWIDIRLAIEMLKNFGDFSEIHDFGCGTGHYLNLIAKHSLASNGRSFGYDVSKTACDKARSLFPRSNFSVLDLTDQPESSRRETLIQEDTKRLFMIRGTLWYVFPKLANVIENIANRMLAGDQLLVSQNFPPLHNSFIGKDVLPDHFALIKHFSSHFHASRHLWYENRLTSANDNWFIGLFSLKRNL
jgi:SAM-dependent methyltransferase